MYLWTEGDGKHLHKTHMNTDANTYADILKTNKEHTHIPTSASKAQENNELGLHQKITQDNHSQDVLMGKQRMIHKTTPFFVLANCAEYYKT